MTGTLLFGGSSAIHARRSDASAASTHKGYRPDIDGLRAIAVLGVILFHAFPSVLRGGFVGVDVFFVISGYLITSIILHDLAAGRFTFWNFYSGRVRRIFPALLVVVSATLAIGFAFSRLAVIKELKSEAAAGLGFYANLYFWSKSGYFDLAEEIRPLLNLWSLGVEEQFYLAWPLLLWLVARFRLNLTVVVGALAIVSFIANIALGFKGSNDAFFLPQARVWELCCGALVVIARGSTGVRAVPARLREAAPFAGLAMVAASFLLLRPSHVYPGFAALLPVVGTVLVVGAGRDTRILHTILAGRTLVALGLISYPLYLWHWPALFFLQSLVPGANGSLGRTFVIALSIVLAAATYLVVERPIRFGRAPRLIWNLGLPAAAVAVTTFAVLISPTVGIQGLTRHQRFVLDQLRQMSYLSQHHAVDLYGKRPCFKHLREQTTTYFTDNGCFDVPDPGAPSVFIIGDSHSASLSLGLRAQLRSTKLNILQASTGWCEPTSNVAEDAICRDINQAVLRRIAEVKPRLVIVDMYYLQALTPMYFAGDYWFYRHFLDFIYRLTDAGAQNIVVVGEIPTWEYALPDLLAEKFVKKNIEVPARTFVGLDRQSLVADDIMRSLAYPASVTYVSLRNLLCNDAGCLTATGPDLAEDLVVWDYGHLTPHASAFIFEKALAPTFVRLGLLGGGG